MFHLSNKNVGNGDKPGQHRILAAHYLTVQIAAALERVGFFNLLRERGSCTIGELAAMLNVEERLLAPCIEFLWSVTDWVERDGDAIKLRTDETRGLRWIINAYKDVFDNLAALLSRDKVYGRDVERNGHFLQKASDAFSADAVRRALGSLADERESVLVDFGCGSGKTLVRYCAGGRGRNAVGIEINPGIVREARQYITASGLGEKIAVIEGDARGIEQWHASIPAARKVIFFASTVLHEFLIRGESSLVGFLRAIGDVFPYSRCIIIEFDGLTPEEIRAEPDPDRKLLAALYEFWHPFTNQGLPQPRAQWERLIAAANWRIATITQAENNLLIYDCLPRAR